MTIDLVLPFIIKVARPPDSMREQCPVSLWPKICSMKYEDYAGVWTVVGTMSSDLWGQHFLAVQIGRTPEYLPSVVCNVIDVPLHRAQVCPVCNGMAYLLSPLPEGMTGGGNWRQTCYGCEGKGWVL